MVQYHKHHTRLSVSFLKPELLVQPFWHSSSHVFALLTNVCVRLVLVELSIRSLYAHLASVKSIGPERKPVPLFSKRQPEQVNFCLLLFSLVCHVGFGRAGPELLLLVLGIVSACL